MIGIGYTKGSMAFRRAWFREESIGHLLRELRRHLEDALSHFDASSRLRRKTRTRTIINVIAGAIMLRPFL